MIPRSASRVKRFRGFSAENAAFAAVSRLDRGVFGAMDAAIEPRHGDFAQCPHALSRRSTLGLTRGIIPRLLKRGSNAMPRSSGLAGFAQCPLALGGLPAFRARPVYNAA